MEKGSAIGPCPHLFFEGLKQRDLTQLLFRYPEPSKPLGFIASGPKRSILIPQTLNLSLLIPNIHGLLNKHMVLIWETIALGVNFFITS